MLGRLWSHDPCLWRCKFVHVRVRTFQRHGMQPRTMSTESISQLLWQPNACVCVCVCVYVPRVVNVHVVQVECPHIRVILRKHLAGDEGCTAHKV